MGRQRSALFDAFVLFLGIGDAADLADLAAVCADEGADFLLGDPVHASQPVSPLETSPYASVSRRWVNPVHHPVH